MAAPPGVEARWRVGDWEGDTIVGQGAVRLVTLVDRKSGFTRIQRVANDEADTVMRAVVNLLAPVKRKVHTITWDNGSEFAKHEVIDLALEAKSYFTGSVLKLALISSIPFSVMTCVLLRAEE